MDLKVREWFALVPLVACMFWVGLYPQYFLARIEPSLAPIEKLLSQRRQSESAPVETGAVDRDAVERGAMEPAGFAAIRDASGAERVLAAAGKD